ncbi:transposase [Leucobacter sp. cx-42]|uniref:transposase n=1 Tax=unclassified Leucobacter TaxID=2621730 RepID=UPI00165DED9A|nr:transposase [Leucobacter sp. cx-42]
MVATDDTHTPIAYQWFSSESQAAWTALLTQIPAPLVVVCDGGPGLQAALTEVRPDTLVQRCILHILLKIRTHLTWNPRTTAGQTLLTLTKQLSRVHTPEHALDWLRQLNAWHTIHGRLASERSYSTRRLRDGRWDLPTGKQWWYTHDRLRRAYRLLVDVQRKQRLFIYVHVRTPRTTSRLEGGINAAIKQTLRLHRGMHVEHQKRAAEWVLFERAGLLETAHRLITPEAIAPKPKTRPRFTEPGNGPELYGTVLDTAEGLWLRAGWGGRALPAQPFTHVLYCYPWGCFPRMLG